MLLQSHLDELHLLPALPQAWPAGEVNGLKARGNFKVDLAWNNHKLQNAKIHSESGERLVLRTTQPVEVKGLSVEPEQEGTYFITSFDTEAGKTYKIIPVTE